MTGLIALLFGVDLLISQSIWKEVDRQVLGKRTCSVSLCGVLFAQAFVCLPQSSVGREGRTKRAQNGSIDVNDTIFVELCHVFAACVGSLGNGACFFSAFHMCFLFQRKNGSLHHSCAQMTEDMTCL